MDALDVVGPGLDVTQMVPDDITQRLLNERIDQQNMADWRNGASPSERVHLQAYSAKGSGHEVSLVPSKTLHTYLTPSEFVNTVSRRLGVDVMDSGMPCCFCGHHLDAQGSHCLSCMAGGDATTLHNGVRDVYFDFCERAGLRPISEAPNILLDVFTLGGRCRPADIPRYARSQFAWTLRSSMLWARITGDTQRSERGPPRMSTALRKLPATTSATNVGLQGIASGQLCMRSRAAWPRMRTRP